MQANTGDNTWASRDNTHVTAISAATTALPLSCQAGPCRDHTAAVRSPQTDAPVRHPGSVRYPPVPSSLCSAERRTGHALAHSVLERSRLDGGEGRQ